MSSNQKHSSLGWTLAISLGIAFSAGVVHAGSIGDPDYQPNDALTAAKMQNIKNAVNDNDTRITTNTDDITSLTGTVNTNTTNITNLTTTVNGHTTSIGTLSTSVTNLATGTGTCVTNNASEEMVRVGSVCVDKYPASLWDANTAGAADVITIPVGCATSGAGCTGIFAQSRATPGTLKDATTISWARAARACANAGKRLVSPAEWMAARSLGSGVVSGDGMFTDGSSEWVDIVTATVDPTGGGGNGTMGVGRMGPDIGGSGGSGAGIVGFLATSIYTDTPGATVGFRCAR
jgi:hypothetical protein